MSTNDLDAKSSQPDIQSPKSSKQTESQKKLKKKVGFADKDSNLGDDDEIEQKVQFTNVLDKSEVDRPPPVTDDDL